MTYINPKTPPIRSLIREVAYAFDLSPDDLTGPRKTRLCVVPRFIAMKLARDLTGSSYPQIGRVFGGRDHASVIAGVRRASVFMAKDPNAAKVFHEIRTKYGEELVKAPPRKEPEWSFRSVRPRLEPIGGVS